MPSQPSDLDVSPCPCPFCEAPGQRYWWKPRLSMDMLAVSATIHDCGTRTDIESVWDEKEPAKVEAEQSALCIARQRLFDGVLARETASLFERLQTTANLGISSGRELRTTMDTLRDAAMSMARTIVNLRYPLPAKGAADAKPD